MTIVRRVMPVVEFDTSGQLVSEYQRGGMAIPFLEAVCRYHTDDGADEIWLRVIDEAGKGNARDLFEPIRKVRQGVFLPLVVWGTIATPSDARLLLGLGADRVIIDCEGGPGSEPVGRVTAIIDAVGSDAVGVAVSVRRVAATDRQRWEVCDREGLGTGRDAMALFGELAAAGAGEIVILPRPAPDQTAIHDGDLVETLAESLPLQIVSVGEDRAPDDLATPLLMGADGIASARLFADGGWRVDEVKSALASWGIPVRPTSAPYVPDLSE